MKRTDTSAGQFNIFGEISKVDKIVKEPSIIENNGLKVITFNMTKEDRDIIQIYNEAIKKARALQPEVKSKGKPFWLDATWQMNRRKRKAMKR